jgi:hypothetical protein
MSLRSRVFLALLAGVGLLAAAAASAATPLPKLQAAGVVGDRVNLTFTGALKPRTGAWTVLVNGKPVTPASITFAGKRVQLRLSAGVYSDDVVRVVGRNLRSAKGARLRALDTVPANRSTPGCSEQLGTMVAGQHREGPTDPATFLPANRFRLYVVRIDFPDYPAFTNPFSPPTTMELSALDREIRDLSYGRSSVSSAGFHANIRMLKNATEYGHTGAWSARRPLLQDVLAQIDPVVDFREYDGLVVQMSLSRGRPGDPPVGPYAIAPPGQGIPVDGKELRHFLFGTRAEALVHPLLQLAGLPSLDGRDVAGWDRMNAFGGRNLLAWHRRKLGWLGPTEVRCLRAETMDVALAPTWRGGGVKALIVPTGSTTAVLLENRQRQGVDAGGCGRGILPYRVDTEAATSPIRVLSYDGTCGGGLTPHDVIPGQRLRAADTVTFELLSVEGDEYRLRVSRRA